MTTRPSDHHLRAAVEVARIIDADGNQTADARRAYRHLLTLGEHRAESLTAGEALLLAAGLLIETDGRLRPTDALAVIAQLDIAEAAAAILARRAAVDLQERRNTIGAAGEAAVIEACRTNLTDLGHPELASKVAQVSLVDDGLGYDVVAPAVKGPDRLLEVKTSARQTPGLVDFFLTRNEYTVGLRNPSAWAVVTCAYAEQDPQVMGWCRASVLSSFLPTDGMGRWTEALVQLPCTHLRTGIPPAV